MTLPSSSMSMAVTPVSSMILRIVLPPGPITSPVSEGCHRLIGERAAEIVTSVADAVEFLSPM